MKSFLKPVLLVGAVVLVPIIPFVLLGDEFESRVDRWVRDDLSPATRAAGIAGVLASDIFLPVPSSAVCTYAGGVMGFWSATATSFVGLTIGSCGGFWLARLLGSRFSDRFAEGNDLHAMRSLVDRFGPVVLLVTRAFPILAEACVLLTGTTRLSWRRFLLPVALGNAAVAAVYVACGVLASERDSLFVASIASGTIPLVIALLARRWLWARVSVRSNDEQAPDSCTRDNV